MCITYDDEVLRDILERFTKQTRPACEISSAQAKGRPTKSTSFLTVRKERSDSTHCLRRC